MSDPNIHAVESEPGSGRVNTSQGAAQAGTALPAGAPADGAPHGAAAQAPAAQAHPGSPVSPQRKLSTFLKVSIILLAALTIASISLLFIGDFEGKFERVFSTFVLFAVFVTFTALDTRREQKSEWYAPVALIANAYILGLLLIVIWMTPYDPFSLLWEIFWKSIFVILVTRLVIFCAQMLLRVGVKHSETVTRFAFVTSVLAVLSGILFTAPVGIEAFDLYIPDMYWKIATAILILTALGLSITLLLRWALGTDARESARADRASRFTSRPSGAPYRADASRHPQPHLQQHPQSGAAPQPLAAPNPHAPSMPPQHSAPLLPWPTFADGRPLPAGPDGQPDFSVPGAPRPPHLQ
ncbi:hypothetical protein [Leucobacter sp. USHLN153]|uniref:hypothetical protein n=1 Tax=Leucobacter sp. USHLN153 TaxID=3081268 RepID=UPI00301B45E0